MLRSPVAAAHPLQPARSGRPGTVCYDQQRMCRDTNIWSVSARLSVIGYQADELNVRTQVLLDWRS